MGYPDGVLDEIRARLDFKAELLRLLPDAKLQPVGHNEVNTLCPFHPDDKTPSLSFNTSNGRWQCHSGVCGAKGDIFTLRSRLTGRKLGEVFDEMAAELGIQRKKKPMTKIVPEKEIASAEQRLWATPTAVTLLQERRSWSEETIRKWRIGWDGQRYWIPIFDKYGKAVNVRKYNLSSKSYGGKMISYGPGFGAAVLCPVGKVFNSEKQEFIILEGEPDVILADQLGIEAITSTGGSRTWKSHWNELFEGKDVVICYDVDDAGIIGSERIARSLHPGARSVKRIQLPVEKPLKDFTDYIQAGHTAEDFRKLIEDAEWWEPTPESGEDEEEPDYEEVRLADASRAEYDGKHVLIRAFVTGKDIAPFLIPWKFSASCHGRSDRRTGDLSSMCAKCPISQAGGKRTITFSSSDRDVLKLFRVSDTQQRGHLLRTAGVPTSTCPVKIEKEEMRNVEELQITPDIRIGSDEGEDAYVERTSYVLSHKVHTNRSYVLRGITVADPRQQYATHIFRDAIPVMGELDSWALTAPLREELVKRFRPAEWTLGSIMDKIKEVLQDMEDESGIYQRQDLFLACDLAHFSILKWAFQGDVQQRGWIEVLVLGDTGTGKSVTAHAYRRMYGVGDIIESEAASFAGLMGGLRKTGERFHLKWGRWVRNHRRLVWIEEASGLDTEVISKLSSVRSSGNAELTKIKDQRTQAFTRAIWLANPRSNRKLAAYSHGVRAVMPLIGRPEDVRRFDLCVTCAEGEVELDVINAERMALGEESRNHPRRAYQQHLLWAWSRSQEQVIFEPSAVKQILMLASDQGQRYDPSIPLVEPNEHRITLARLSVALAARLYSTTPDGETVVVRAPIVDYAAAFLDECYKKRSLGYADYSAQEIRRKKLKGAERLEELMNADKIEALLEMDRFTTTELQDVWDCDRKEIRGVLSTLRDCRAIKRSASGAFYRTPAFIEWLRQRNRGDEDAIVPF